MKGVQVKKALKSIGFAALLYVLLLALLAFLAMRSVLREEQLGTACMLCAGVTAFFAALVHRIKNKEGSFFSSLLFGGGFLPFAVLAGFLLYGEISIKGALGAFAAVLVALAAANAIYAKVGFGKKKRGRGRGTKR